VSVIKIGGMVLMYQKETQQPSGIAKNNAQLRCLQVI
jgi:hypothetical protein